MESTSSCGPILEDELIKSDTMKTRMSLFTFLVPRVSCGQSRAQELDQAKDVPIITATLAKNSGTAPRGLGYVSHSGWSHGASVDKKSGKV